MAVSTVQSMTLQKALLRNCLSRLDWPTCGQEIVLLAESMCWDLAPQQVVFHVVHYKVGYLDHGTGCCTRQGYWKTMQQGQVLKVSLWLTQRARGQAGQGERLVWS